MNYEYDYQGNIVYENNQDGLIKRFTYDYNKKSN